MNLAQRLGTAKRRGRLIYVVPGARVVPEPVEGSFVMLVLLYSALFLALSAALLRWQGVRYEREHRLVPQPLSRRNPARSAFGGEKR